jgi:uncharacterized damage-inducible protein DinB
MSPDQIFLQVSADKLDQLAGRIATCLGQLTPEQVWARGTENVNAVGNLVLHLCGNVRQWIGFGVAGQPDIRQRDAEFAARGGPSLDELKAHLHAAVSAASAIIRELPPSELGTLTRIQNYEITKLQAIYHVVEHFSGHTGQIIFATKFLTGADLGFYRHLAAPRHEEKTP